MLEALLQSQLSKASSARSGPLPSVRSHIHDSVARRTVALHPIFIQLDLIPIASADTLNWEGIVSSNNVLQLVLLRTLHES